VIIDVRIDDCYKWGKSFDDVSASAVNCVVGLSWQAILNATQTTAGSLVIVFPSRTAPQ
jgi:hypothetical protein